MVVKNGRLDYNNFMSLIEQSALFFSMIDVETGVPKITSRPAGFVEKTNVDPNADPEYYLYYQFQNRDTNRVGRYEGQFMLRSSDGVLILTIREKLYINVQESYIDDDLEYDSCYVSEFPCCVNGPATGLTINLNLTSVVTPSSVKVDYTLTSSEVLNDNLTLDFKNILGQIVGTGLTITTGITISAGSNIGFTEVILPDDYYNLDGTSTFGDVVVVYPIAYNFVESFNTIFPPAPSPSVTPTPTPTPTPAPDILDAILTDEVDVYIESGLDEYLSYVDPTIQYLLSVTITNGSIITYFNVSSNIPINEVVSIPINLILPLIGGGTITISGSVIIPANQTSGQTITTNPLLDFNDLDQTGEILIDTPNIGFPINISAEQINFVLQPTPTPTPTITPTPTPTQTITPTPSATPIVFKNYLLTRCASSGQGVASLSGSTGAFYDGSECWITVTETMSTPTLFISETFVDCGDCLNSHPTPTPTPTNTPTPSPIPQAELTLYIQGLSGGQSIIFDGGTYSTDSVLTINKNQSYNIQAVPQSGYLFVGWNIFGGSFSSTAQTTTVSVSIDSGANLAPSYAPDPNYDALEAQMTTSLSAYQSATINDWVRITSTEYYNIVNNVPTISQIGNNDLQVATRDPATGYETTTFGTTDVDTPLTIPSGSYVVAFVAESWNQNGQVQFGYTTTYHNGTPTYMNNSPQIFGGFTCFYVRKRPSGVEGAPSSTNLYPVLNFIAPAYPNAVIGTYGWYTSDGGTNWSQTNPAGTTAKIQILLATNPSWPI